MQNLETESNVQKVILFFGERLAFILFFVFVLVLLLSGHATTALSHEETPQTVKQEANWYQNGTSLPVKHEEKLDVTYNLLSVEVTPTPTPAIITAASSSNGAWEALADCETHGNWHEDTGNGYYGGLQFNMSAWNGTGGTGNPAAASKDEQIMRGKILQARRGWGPWNACAKKLDLL